MNWLVYTLLAMVSVAIADLGQRVSLTHKNNISSVTNNFYLWGIIGLISLVYAQVFRIPPPSNFVSLGYWLPMFVLALVYFFGGTFFYQSFKSNSVSLSTLLGTISSVITTILGIIFFQESTSLLKFFGSALILVAIFIVTYSKKNKLDKYNLYAIIGGSFYGIAYTMDKMFVSSSSPHFHQFVVSLSVAFVSLLFKSRQITMESRLLDQSSARSMLISIIFFFLFQKFIFTAYAIGGEVGRIDILNNATIFIILILEIFILKDKTRLKSKILASLVAVIGATFLTLAK